MKKARPGSVVGSILNPLNVAASIESRKRRVSEDQETVKGEIKAEEKIEKEKKALRILAEKASKKKETIEGLKGDLGDALDLGDVNLAKDTLDQLTSRAKEYGVFDSMQDAFDKMQKDIAELRDIEKEEKRIDDLKLFEDSDYRAMDADGRSEYIEKMKGLFEGGENNQEYQKIKSRTRKRRNHHSRRRTS